MALTLYLRSLGHVRGIYGPSKTVFPTRGAFMYPAAAAAFGAMQAKHGEFVYSDIYRAADESLRAVKAGKGAQPPGYSGHNFGLSVDVAVDEVMRERKISYSHLCDLFAEFDFHPYRQDRTRGSEDWHFNYLGDSAETILAKTHLRANWQFAAEEMIRVTYPVLFPPALSPEEIQEGLKKLGLYSGNVDGALGPLSRVSMDVFRAAWSVTGTGDRFQRTLSFVSADKQILV